MGGISSASCPVELRVEGRVDNRQQKMRGLPTRIILFSASGTLGLSPAAWV